MKFVYTYCESQTYSYTLKFANPVQIKNIESIKSSVFNLGMCLLAFVWMGYCTKRIVVQAGYLSQPQVRQLSKSHIARLNFGKMFLSKRCLNFTTRIILTTENW